jgi:hypothetical protein
MIMNAPISETQNEGPEYPEGYPGPVGAKVCRGGGGGKPRQDHGPPTLTSLPLNVVKLGCSVFKGASEHGDVP